MNIDVKTHGSPNRCMPQRQLAVVIVHTWAPKANAHNYQQICARGLGNDIEVHEVRVAGFDAVRRAAEEAVQAGASLIIAVGGDGTVNAVINGMGTSSARLIVLPGGTGNCLNYQVGQGTDAAAIAATMSQFVEVKIDTLRANGHRFLLGANLGIIAEINAMINRWRTKKGLAKRFFTALGEFIYVLAIWLVWLHPRRIGGRVRIEYRDLKDNATKRLALDASSVDLFCSPTLGASAAPLLPFSVMDDGKFEVTVWTRMNSSRLLKFLMSIGKGLQFSMPEATTFQTDYCEIECEHPIAVFLDGEPTQLAIVYRYEIDPHPIHMMVPKGEHPGLSKRLPANS